MIRSKSTALSAVLLSAVLIMSTAQDAPAPASQTTPAEPEPAVVPDPKPLEPELRNVSPIVEFGNSQPRRIEVKPGASANRKSSASITRNGRTEVRAFAFNNDPFGGQKRRPLMIRSSRADVKAMDQLSEDLTVMTRLLEKAVMEHGGGFHPRKAGGIEILTLNAGMPYAGGAMYVDDYGVIFTLSVNMPLKAEAKVEEVQPKEPKRRGAWEETRSEIYGGERRRIMRWQPSAWRQFDQEELDAFKNTLIDSLREATNIRHLKPMDMVAVVVRGTPQAEEREIRLQIEGNGKDEVVTEESSNPESTLVLRIQKADLDRAVAGSKDSSDLRKAVRVSIY